MARNNYANAFAGRRLGSDVALGLQAWTGGDDAYRVYGTGLAADGFRAGPVRLTLMAGTEHADAGRTQPGFDLEFSGYRD